MLSGNDIFPAAKIDIFNDYWISWTQSLAVFSRATIATYLLERSTGKLLTSTVSSFDFDPSHKAASRVIAEATGITTAFEYICY